MSNLCPCAASCRSLNLGDEPKTIGGSLLWLLKCKKFCDVTFTFPNAPHRIQAHEFCLKARSPVFEQIFRMRKPGNVQGNEIEISESTPERFQQFLEFIYSDKFELDITGALDLLPLAQKYKVHPLSEKCDELLQAEIPIVDSVKAFETARRYRRPELMNRAGLVMVKQETDSVALQAIRSFLELVGTGALANAEEQTLVYLLESDDLAVKEVGLFRYILDWGRNQVGASSDQGLLRNKLKNLLSKIRYANMALDEFTKVVVPTGLLSAEETVSVYSYLCGDEVSRWFELAYTALQSLPHFHVGPRLRGGWFPAFSKQSMSFKADRTEIVGKVWPDYLLKKTGVTAIRFYWPSLGYPYKDPATKSILNFNVSVREYSGPVKKGNVTMIFQKKLLNCKQETWDEVSVEPPVELVSGRTYSIILEDHSTSDLIDSFRRNPSAYLWVCVPNTDRKASVDFGDSCMTLKEIHQKTEYYE